MATADNYDVDEDTQRAFPPDEGIPEPEYGHGFIDRKIQELEPIPVRLMVDHGVVPVVDVAPDFGSGQTTFTSVGFQPKQILPQSNKRKRAVIMVQPGAALNTLGAIYLGSQAQMNAGAATAVLSGMRLINGSVITIESKGELWLAGDGANSLCVSAWDERYQ